MGSVMCNDHAVADRLKNLFEGEDTVRLTNATSDVLTAQTADMLSSGIFHLQSAVSLLTLRTNLHVQGQT
jgi:hypothetical protein